MSIALVIIIMDFLILFYFSDLIKLLDVFILFTGHYYHDILILDLQGKQMSVGLLVSQFSFWEQY